MERSDQAVRVRERSVSLFADGNSYTVTANIVYEEFGVRLTRNSIAGYVSRAREAGQGIPRRAVVPTKMIKRTPKEPKPRKVNAKAPPRPPQPRPQPLPEPPAFTLPPIAATGLDAVLTHREGSCGWPVGDPKEASFRYCCAPCGPKATYCEWHAKLGAGSRDARDRQPKPKILGMTMRRLSYG